MGYLLKEALKSICGVNQWSYAVFWKIGCQNPNSTKIENQGLTLEELDKCWLSPEASLNQLGAHVGAGVDLLVKKMMVNQVHVVGEGLVGRTAFTGNHQWIVSGYFNDRSHPPEVVNEVQLQFLHGMQTVALIPAIPHGVIQLGSSLNITENTGFIHDVMNLILHLGCIPGALVSDNYVKGASVEGSGMPFTRVVSAPFSPHMDELKFDYSTAFDGANQKNSYQDCHFGNLASHSISSKVQDNLKTTASDHSHNQNVSFQGNECQSSRNAEALSVRVLDAQNKALRAEAIPFKPDAFVTCKNSYTPGSGPNHGQLLLLASDSSHNSLEKQKRSVAGYEACTQASAASASVVQSPFHSQFSEPYDSWISSAQNVNFSSKVAESVSVMGDQPIGISSSCSHLDDDMHQYSGVPEKHGEKDLYEGLNIALPSERDLASSNGFLTGITKIHNSSKVSSCETALSEINSSVEGDLFDVLGVAFKNKILNGCAGNFSNNAGKNLINQVKSQDLTSATYPEGNRTSGSGKLSAAGSDHVLDVMVPGSGVYSAATQISDDNISCKTTLTNTSLSAPSSSLMFAQGSITQQMCELFEPSKTSVRSQNGSGNCTQTSSFYGSRSSSWVEQGPNAMHEASIATANSKKSGEVGKPARKRLKPGENPRPRPKDRQMFQDRVKELREMVPNGAKCSLDALLEQTIKHMLFLQSVTQNADKLKQTVESKIINKDGGLLPKVEGGATWAYEVGSQGNVCPIVVEDLDAPRQLLVEMLCEQRGFFLEIADIIRGMGLTILKGVMETRRDKIWARFAVEANRDVTRMEVCLSLVHLLEQTGKNNNLQKDGSINSNGVVHPTFDHTAAVPENLVPTDLP